MTGPDAFPPTRAAALDRLAAFVPHAGLSYAQRRNFDLGPDQHDGVSRLSPYLRCRLITEQEVIAAVLARHPLEAAGKFVQEVFWRTYWKGWLELRPGVWDQYLKRLHSDVNDVHTQSGLRARWEAACLGTTGIDCFDAWARELVQTGYLHNHARMWFASIWIFTLHLPWALGADFFLRHLLDGDPASNTLSWRWVSSQQTPGKSYLARADNIKTFTNGRFNPQGLAPDAPPLSATPPPDPRPLPPAARPDASLRTGLLLHSDDLSPDFVLQQVRPCTTLALSPDNGFSPLTPAPHIAAFRDAALRDTLARGSDTLGQTVENATSPADILNWAARHDLQQIVTPHAPVGPIAAIVNTLRNHRDAPAVVALRRPYDDAAWPLATRGFFQFRKHIPDLVSRVI